jgi:hypothetical protein
VKRALLVAILVAVALPGAASAKGIKSLVLVGAGGRSQEFPYSEKQFQALTIGTGAARTRGGYVLVYPIMDLAVAAQPGRYYPATRAYCASWTLAAPRYCSKLSRATARPLAAVPLLHGAPPTATVVDERIGAEAMLNVEAFLVLTFLRDRGVPVESRPRDCSLNYTARWRHADFPSRFCLGPRGIWADGKLRALPAAVYEFARLNP